MYERLIYSKIEHIKKFPLSIIPLAMNIKMGETFFYQSYQLCVCVIRGFKKFDISYYQTREI